MNEFFQIMYRRRRYDKRDGRNMHKALQARGYTYYARYLLDSQDREAHPRDQEEIRLYRNERNKEAVLRLLPGGRCELYSRIPADDRGAQVLIRGNDAIQPMLDALDALDASVTE